MYTRIFRYLFLLSTISVSSNFISSIKPGIKFTNRNSAIALADANSKFKYGTGSLTGWNQQSIVKDSGDDSLKTGDADGVITYATASEDLIVNNSNAIIYGLKNNSNALLYGLKNNSNALLYGLKNNSNALIYGIKNNSNALTYGLKNNSNALLYGIKNNSNTIVALDNYIDNELDGAVRANSRNISYNSNALLYGIANNSNALNYGLKNNSNALLYGIKNNSNALIYGIKNNSNALLYGIKNNSNALTYGLKNNSNTIKYQSDHFIIINNGKLSALGQISGHTTLNSKGFVENSINLNNRTLNLNGDLNIASGTTIDSDGKLNLNGYSIILDGDLTLPTDTVITITSSGIIDGKNHNLNFNNHSQIFVDTNITLTLKNITVNNIVNPLTFPPIRLAATNSKLTLDNVKLACNNDFLFPQGQLFIHNDINITGTSKFIYQSTSNSYVTKQSSLNFGPLTTFDFSTSSSNKNLINLKDSSSNIKFDGCSLQTTYTGLNLTKGNVIFDNKVTTSAGQYKINNLTLIDSKAHGFVPVDTAHWSPDSKFLAIGLDTSSNNLIIYSFDGTALTDLITQTFGSSVKSVAWSPDGKYLAVGGTNGTEDLIIYSFDGSNLTQITTKDHGTEARSVAWSPDGKYISIGGINGTEDLIIYSFDGTNLNTITSKDFATQVNSISWRPDGNYLAVGGTNSTEDLIVYSFDGTNLNQIATADYSAINSVSWNPDGDYLAVGGSDGTQPLRIYNFNGTTLTLKTSKNNGTVYSLAWASDGRYFIEGTNEHLRIYSFDGINLTEHIDYGMTDRAWSMSLRPDGNYLTIGIIDLGDNLFVYSVDKIFETYNQAFSNSLVFGNSILGSNYNPTIIMQNSTRLEPYGSIYFDSAKLDYASKNASIALNNSNSRIKFNSVDNVYGWSEQSIIKSTGNNNSWLSDNIIYGNEVGDTAAPTDLVYSNSNTIVYLDNYIDTELDGAVRANSRNISYNSNALLYGIKNNSNALIYGVKNNSNTLTYGLKNNSNALIYGIKNNSNALLCGIKNNSNTIVSLDNYIDTQLDGAVRANSRNISYNSNALLYGIANNSNALNYGLKNNSNALIYGIKNNSNAITYGLKNNSNALLYGIKNNSNTIVSLDNYIDTELDGAVRANSRNIVYNSNASLFGIKNNSNALKYLDNYVRTQVDGSIRANSRNIVYNSNTIVSLDNYIDTQLDGAVRANSRNISYNSNAIINLESIDDQTLGAVRANSRNIVYNSNASLFGIKNNSNALKYLDTYVRTQVDGSIRANSRNIVYNSNALLYSITNNSNAIIKNTRNILSNSNTLLYGIKNNSNAIINLGSIDDQTLGAVRANSRNISYNSNALKYLDNYVRTEVDGSISANSRNIVYNSNASLFGIKNNSNALKYLDNYVRTQVNGSIRANSRNIVYNSNTIVSLDNYIDTELDGAVRANSRNISYNSNAIINLESIDDQTLGAVRANSRNIVYNSNASLFGIKNNSNALKYLDTYVRTQVDGSIRANSRNIVYNSNAILNVNTDQETILGNIRANSRNISYNSNALTYGIKNNSNAIISLGALDLSALQGAVRANSRNIVYNSNAILSLGALDLSVLQGAVRANSRNIVYNSNAILSSINAAGQGTSHNVDSDIDLGGTAENPEAFYLSRGIDTAPGTNPTITLHAGFTFFSSPIDLDGGTLVMSGGDVIFSSGTTIESSGNFSPIGHAIVFGNDLRIPDGVELTFTTSGIIDGQDHNLIFEGSAKLKLDNHVTLTIKNTHLKKLKDFSDNTSSICMNQSKTRLALQNAELYLDRDLTFTLGELYIMDNVAINGTNQFIYTTTQYLRIDTNSTLMFDFNSSFSYAPIQAKNNLIVMQNSTSELFLNGASLKTTYTGLQLTKGTLVLDHKNYLYNQDADGTGAASSSQAIIFGDGISADNDLHIEILPGGSLDLKTGILEFRNINN